MSETLHRTLNYDTAPYFLKDTSCAIANAYCALESGATHIDGMVLGIGEHNGVPPLGGLMTCLETVDRGSIQNQYRIYRLGYIAKACDSSRRGRIAFRVY